MITTITITESPVDDVVVAISENSDHIVMRYPTRVLAETFLAGVLSAWRAGKLSSTQADTDASR